MTLKASFVFRNPDSTSDLNDRLRHIVKRGIVMGGNFTPDVGMRIKVDPFVAVGYDGLAISDTDYNVLNVAIGVKQYVVVRARYNAFGSPTPPVLVWQILTDAAYAADPEKDYLVVFGTVTSAGPAVTSNDISFTERDEVNQLGRDWYRGKVAVAADLPIPPPAMNRVGDFYYVEADNTFYFWTGMLWEPMNTGSYNVETERMNDLLIKTQRNRMENGTGLLASRFYTTSIGVASMPEINFINPSAPQQFNVDTFSALVNGHYVGTRAQTLTLDPKPAVGYRYDVVFLEVWRTPIAVPETHVYDRATGGSYTAEQADDVLEQATSFSSGLTGNNFDIEEIDARSHNWALVNYRLSYTKDVPVTSLYQTHDAAPVSANIDGNPFSTSPINRRTWKAVSTTALDGVSWAMPLFVIRRYAAETNILQNDPDPSMSGYVRVCPVYPICDSSHVNNMLTFEAGAESITQLSALDYSKASGFISGLDTPITAGLGPNEIKFFESDKYPTIRIRGIEEQLRVMAEFEIDAPPGGGWSRTMVYIKLNLTLNRDKIPSSAYLSNRRFLINCTQFGGSGLGFRYCYATFTLEYKPLAADVLDEYDAMTALGWTAGDMSSSGAYRNDAGIWSRYVGYVTTTQDNVHVTEHEWAIPVCLVHRRNTALWTWNTNPNGTGITRPDDRKDATVIHPDDLVDLRHRVDVGQDELEKILQQDISKLMRGQLRTRMANKWAGTAGTGGTVAGSRILQVDYIGNTGGVAFDLPVSNPTIGTDRRIWSDAREFHVISRGFNLAGSFTDPLLEWDFPTKTLTVRAPTGAHLVTHLPAIVHANASGNFLTYPCWLTPERTSNEFVTQQGASPPLRVGSAVPCWAKRLDTSGAAPIEARMAFGFIPQYPKFTVTASDTFGHATEMQCTTITSWTGRATLTWWVHYDRMNLAPYNVNHGLAEIPDVVHAVIVGPNSGTPRIANVGAIHASVKKTLAPGATSYTITAADVTAASGLPGTVVFEGVDPGVIKAPSAAIQVASVTMTSARDSVTITFSGPYATGGQVDTLVFFKTTSVNDWVEIGRGGKSVRASFRWGEFTDTFPGVIPNDYAISLDSVIWSRPEVGGRVFTSPFVWTRVGAGQPYTLTCAGILSASQLYIGHELSNMISIYNSVGYNAAHREILVTAPFHYVITNAVGEEILIAYTYTPYQGLSSSGGAVATVPAATTKLKSMLHGTIEADSGFYATQTGATSVYGGVDSWTGEPARISRYYGVDGSYLYNSTHLVKSARRYPFETSSPTAESLNSAAVLRMPFPGNPNMVAAGVMKYVADFDLDAWRQGASAGFYSYAPGYSLFTLQHWQFVNGLSPLTAMAAATTHPGSKFVDLYSMALLDGTSPSVIKEGTYPEITVPQSVQAVIGIPTGDNRFSSLCNIIMQVDRVESGDLIQVAVPFSARIGSSLADANGLMDEFSAAYFINGAILSYNFWTNVSSFTDDPLLLSVQTGSILNYLKRGEILAAYFGTQVRLLMNTDPTAHDRRVKSAMLVVDTEEAGGTSSEDGSSPKADTLYIPASCGSARSLTTNSFVSVFGMLDTTGLEVSYPSSWSAPLISTLEGYIQPSTLFYSQYGRGLYFGTSQTMTNMPLFVPGSGDPLSTITVVAGTQIESTATMPVTVPSAPAIPLFGANNRTNTMVDHGGNIAYVFKGLLIRPNKFSSYFNSLVLQISGGSTENGSYASWVSSPADIGATSNKIYGTAIDAFWPTNRPLLNAK